MSVPETAGVATGLSAASGFAADFAACFFAGLAGAGACARAPGATIPHSTTATTPARIWKETVFPASAFALPAQDGSRVGILAKRLRISAAQNFHHPVIKIVDRMRLNGLESAIVFFVSLFNVITQSETQILVLAAHAHIFRAQHLDVLHGNFGDAESAPVQFLLLRGQHVEIKSGRRFSLLNLMLRFGKCRPFRIQG